MPGSSPRSTADARPASSTRAGRAITFPDFWKAMALHRMRTVLHPGGVLPISDIAYSFDRGQAEERIEQWCETLPG